MSKHTLTLFSGRSYEWDDDKPEQTEEYRLLKLNDDIWKYHYLSTYEGEDPYGEWNEKISQLSKQVIQWLEELDE